VGIWLVGRTEIIASRMRFLVDAPGWSIRSCETAHVARCTGLCCPRSRGELPRQMGMSAQAIIK
jgi:hypothetical protein